MANKLGVRDLVDDPEFGRMPYESQSAVFDRVSREDAAYRALSPEVQAAVRSRVVRKEPSISAPPSIRDYLVADLRRTGEEALPMLGLVAGGALGTAAGGPLGGLGGAGLGYAAGQQANRTIGSIANYIQGRPEAPPSVPGQALKLGKEFATGAMLEALPVPALGASRGIGNVLREQIGIGAPTAEDLAVRAAAERLGIPLPAAAASGSAPVSLLESIPARFPIGRQTAERAAEPTQASARRAAETLQAEIGPAKSLERAGQGIQMEITAIARAQENAPTELLDRFMDSIGTSRMGNIAFGGSLKAGGTAAEKARRLTASQLYEEALAAGGRDSMVPLSTTNQIATQMLQFEQRLGGTSPGKIAKTAAGLKGASEPPSVSVGRGETIDIQKLPVNFIQRYELDTGGRTLEEVVAIQQRLRSLVRNTSDDYTRRQLKTLLEGVTTDIQTFGETAGGDFGAQLIRASNYYREEVASLFARRSPLRRLFNKEPGAVAKDVLSHRDPDQITALMRTLPAREQDEFRRQMLERMKQRSLDIGTGEVDPVALIAEMNRFGDENMTLLMGSRVREVDALKKTLAENFGRDTTNKDLAKVITANPEQIINTLARGKLKSIDDFNALWSNISPVTQQETRGALYNEVLTNSFDDATGRFSIDRFLRQKEMVPQDIWDRMLAPNPAAALSDLERVFRRIGYFSKVAANPSQTSGAFLAPAQIIGTTAMVGGLAASTVLGREDPLSVPFVVKLFGVLSPLALPTLLGKVMFSPMGQRLLTSQLRPPINPQGAAATAMKLGGAQVLIDNPDLQGLLK